MITTIIIILALLFSFFFSGLEIAYVSANKLQMHVDSRKVSLTGRLFSRITNSPVRFLATVLLGNTLALVVFGVFSADVLVSMLAGFHLSSLSMLAIQSVVTTFIVLVIADFIPKNLFRGNPNLVLKVLTLPCIIAYYVLLPFTLAVLAFVQFLMTKVFRLPSVRYKSTFNKADLFSYIEDHSNPENETSGEAQNEVMIFQNALSFPDVKVRDCMIPRMDISAVDINEGFEKLKQQFEKTELSRIVVYKDTIDNIIGYVHFHAMFKKADDIHTILLPAPLVPESMPAKDALRILMQQHKSLSVVVDEFGMTSGIITTEDILEEIFGEIADEHDRDELTEKEISANEFIFSARLKIDDINSKYNLDIPASKDYLTLGGFILNHTGAIPKARETIIIHNFSFKILSSTSTRIEQVYLTRERKRMNKVYLSLGSNRGNRMDNLSKAIKLLLERVGSAVATSSVYETQPWKMEDETDFLNQVVLLETNLSASEVMSTILEIESLLGRVRTQQKYEPRTIDIDILFFNEEVINEPNLVVPHPFIAQRRFIVEPMAEIAGTYIHPVLKKTMAQLTSECQDKNRIRKVVTK